MSDYPTIQALTAPPAKMSGDRRNFITQAAV